MQKLEKMSLNQLEIKSFVVSLSQNPADLKGGTEQPPPHLPTCICRTEGMVCLQ